jgi:hypothetical protein
MDHKGFGYRERGPDAYVGVKPGDGESHTWGDIRNYARPVTVRWLTAFRAGQREEIAGRDDSQEEKHLMLHG